jgi:hypothetical protein
MRWTNRCGVYFIGLLLAALAASAATPCASDLTARIPSRPGNATGGTAFVASLVNLDRDARDAEILAQVLSGNVPGFLRRLVPVLVTGMLNGAEPRAIAATLCVMPDYLAVGSDSDFVHVPLGMPASAAIARTFGFVLPTGKIVDAIHEQATYKLRPQPLAPSPQMTRPEYVLTHERRIRLQEAEELVEAGAFVAGHKKDIVLTNLLALHPDRVAIYGWHYPDGRAIQPLSVVHGAHYADYSHGLRLVSDVLEIDGRRDSVYAVLADAPRANVLSSEGPIADARALIADPPHARAAAETGRPAAGPPVQASRRCCSSESPGDSCGGCPRP